MALSYLPVVNIETIDETIARIDKLPFRDFVICATAYLFGDSEFGIQSRYEGGELTPNAMAHYALALRFKREFALDVPEPNLNSPRLSDEVPD